MRYMITKIRTEAAPEEHLVYHFLEGEGRVSRPKGHVIKERMAIEPRDRP